MITRQGKLREREEKGGEIKKNITSKVHFTCINIKLHKLSSVLITRLYKRWK